MKKKLVFIISGLLLFMVMGCSSDDNGNTPSTVDFYGTEIPYSPKSISDMPDWIAPYLQTDSYCMVCIGTKDHEVIYHVNNLFSSSLYGWFFDKDGNGINVNTDIQSFVKEIKDWKCIYYRD